MIEQKKWQAEAPCLSNESGGIYGTGQYTDYRG